MTDARLVASDKVYVYTRINTNIILRSILTFKIGNTNDRLKCAMSERLDEDTLDAVADMYDAIAAAKSEIEVQGDYAVFLSTIANGFTAKTLSLRCLHVSMSVLTYIPKILRARPDVTSICLFENMLQDSGATSVHQILLANPQIRYLDIGCNDLSDASMTCLEKIVKETEVERLQIGCMGSRLQTNRLSPEAVSQVVDTIAKADRLKCLGMSGILLKRVRRSSGIVPVSSYIGDMIGTAKNLSTLDISQMNFVENDQAALNDGFAKNESLRILSICNNSFGGGTLAVEGIAKVVTLKSLNMSNCKLDDTSAMILAESIRSGWGIIRMNLANNRIGSSGALRLLEVLENNNTLVLLNLSGNDFDHTVAESFGEMIHANQVLSDVDLSRNSVGDSLLIALAPVIATNESLRSLGLSGCRLGDSGLLTFAKSVVRNKALRRITLRDNFLSRQLGYQLLEVLQPNETIIDIDLASNQVELFDIDAIHKLCTRNKDIQGRARLMPLIGKLIDLQVQRAKIPTLEERLVDVKGQSDAVEKKRESTEAKLEKFNERSLSELSASRKAIDEYNMMIAADRQSIQEMTDALLVMERESEARLAEIKSSASAQRDLFEKQTEAAKEAEGGLEALTLWGEETERQLRAEIGEVEAMIQEVGTVLRDNTLLRDYRFPSVPGDSAGKVVSAKTSARGSGKGSRATSRKASGTNSAKISATSSVDGSAPGTARRSKATGRMTVKKIRGSKRK